MKLYRVESKGLGTHYSVAPDAETAYQLYKKVWDKADYGFYTDRDLVSVRVLAEEMDSPVKGRPNLQIIKEAK